MDCNVQLMSRSCVTTVFLWAVGILLFLDRITTSQELDYQFDLPFYESPGKWFTCDKGWNGVGNNCLLLETDRATYDEAQTFCESYGAELLKIQSLHDNVVYGEILRTRAELTPDLRYFWIGLSRNGSGTYVWGDGEVALANQGFWTLNQPQSFQLGFRQCTYLGVNNATDFGLYRWALGDCQQRLPFVCQTSACAISDFRCEDGKQCINSDWVCDNTPDCQDQSDELNCNGTCGESLQGTHGTFHSPNHNSSYPSYSFCHWKITSPLGTRIQLHFHSFDLEAPYDNVSIYDGALASDPLVGIFAGNHTPSIPLSSTNFILVIFQSDQNIAGTGFLVTWTAENISCGGLIYTDNQPRLISSPNYMNRSYPENLVCDWHLSDPNRESIIHISFPNFSLAGPGDWLEVRDGSTEHDGLFGRYTGDSLPNVLISSGPHLFVRFRTNQAVGALGFMGISQNGCHHKSIGPDNAAIYTSPGYGVTNYPNNLNCSWIYSGESPATLIFHHIQIEPNYDQLQVKVGNETNFRLISNHDELSRLRSTSGHYLIKFSSDGQVSMKGWKLSISQDCQEPSSLPDHISISSRSHNFSYGSSVWFKCDEGYIISNENQIVCQLGGKWNASIPTCKLITCGPVGIPQNGSLESLNSTLYGGLAVFMCDIGFRMNGNITSSCTAQGWTPLPVCEEVSCPKLHPPPYSDNTIYPESNKFGAKVIYSCKTGYRLIGSSVSVCGEEGMWSHASPQCLAPFCEEINIPNAMFNTSSPIGGDYMGVYCANGYVLTGEGVLYCNTSGLYETAFPTCSDFDECSMEEKNPCQPHNCHNIPGSYICQCNQGYRHRNGSHGRQCEDVDECSLFFPCENSCKNLNGSYHCGCSASQLLYTGPEVRVQGQKVLKPHFSCVKTCSAFTVQNNGTVYANTTIWNDLYIYPTSLFIHCPFGTSPDGPTTVYCQEDGKWSHSITQCDHLYCPVLSPPLNGYVHYSDNTRKVGTMATYQCNSGFQINFASQKLCQLEDADEAFWEGNSTLPTCQMVQCSPLMAPQFGDVSSNSTSYGAQAEYKCQCGYSLVGSKHRTCTKDGIWNGVNAFCIRATCPVPRPPLYGSIADKMYTSPYFVGTSVYYTCGNRQGYQLTNSKNMSTCVVDKTYDAEIPIRLVVLEMNFTGSERMENASCKQHYESKAMTTLVTADAVQAVCTDVYIRTVKAVSTSTLSTKSISLTLSVAIQSTYGVSKNVCYCEDNLLKTLHTTLTLSENLDSGCPNLTSKNKRQIKSSNWSCPAEYTLENDGATCLLNPEPTCSRTADTPYYLLEVNVTLRGTKFNVTSCVESLRGYIEHAVQNKSDTILNNIMSSHGWPLNWSQCKTIKDMVLLNTTGHINIRNDKIYLIVPFAVQSRNVSIGNMESCIYDNVTKYVHSNFYTDLTTILKQVYGVCGAIDLQSYEHNVTVQCPNQYQFHTPSQTCHRYPVTTIPPELSTPSVELMTLPFMPVVDIELTIDFLSSVSSDSIMCNQKLTNLISTALSEQAIVLNQHSEFVSRCANNNIVFQFSDSIKSHRKNTSFVVTVIISFYATSEHVSSMMFNTCFSTVIGKFQMFPSMVLGKSSLETGNSCGRLTIQKAIPINMSNSCMPDYIYLPQYNRCRDRFGAIFTVVIDATYLIFQIQDPLCFSVLTNQVKYHINNFENSMPTTNIIPACNDTILLPINVTANVSTKDGNTQIIFSIQLEFQNLKGNNNRATRCEKEIQSKFLLKGGLKTFLEENVVNETSGSCTIPPNMTSFVIKQMYFQCTDDREWQEETLSCVKRRRRKRSRKLGVTKWTLETILSRPRTKKGIKDKTIPHYWPILSDVVSFETSELNHDVPVVKSSLPQRWKRDTQLMIQTVSDEVTEANVHWQNNVTACIDVEPPQFIDCPSSPVKIPLGRDDPLPREITLPIAKDNSNLPPYVVYDPPAIIKQPYLFQNNTVINITATDYEGNTNYCSFRVLLIDESPPVMECPAEVVYAHYTEASVNVSLRYSNMRNILKIKDLSKWTLHLNPGNGMWIRTRELIDITATATDINGNAASCNFTYEAQGGDISQAYQIEIQVYVKPNMSNSDARSCLRNYTQSLVIHYMNVAKNVCNEGASNDFLIINKAEQLNLSIKKPSVQAYVNMTFSISSNGNSNLSECVGKLISELKSEGSNLYTADGCAPANITLISVSGRYLCPNEYILNTSRNICVQCHRGYYADQTNHICQRCTAENPNNITDCIPCSVKNSPTCLKYCRPGEYSENGLQPCIKCAIGSYTNKSGSTICQVCNQGSTLSIGSTSPTECHDICPAGFYSNTGLNVTECFPCPQNYYSAGPGSTSCTPCPIGTITEGIQSTQMSMCQVYNLCDNCQNNSTCMDVDQGRWYMCVCPPGFHGHNCDQDVDECLSQPCMHEGICHNGMNSYHCTCSEGYTGNHCEVPISGCSSYPCVYGVCTEHANNSHVCTCYPGFTGPSCETNQNDCNSTSCLNGGTCIDQINSFVCNCTGTGYEGTRCDHKRPNLTLNKCFNGDYHQNLDQCSCNSGWSGAYCETRVGNCVDGSHCGSNGHCVEFGVTNVTCICKPGFTGTYCTEKIRKCNSFLCQNNGICEEKGADFACLCPQGYTGRVCEKDIDDCASSPCRNDTTLQCVDGQDTFLCQCVPGWSGSRCDAEITECQSSPCHRGGTCVDLVNDYYCKCPAGFTGKDCSMFSSCLSTPCYNSGTCQYNEMGDFNCLCPKGFTGRTCEQEIDECSSSQCQNGGTCHDFVNDFKCSCLQGFMGQFCEEQEKECLSQPCQNGGTCHEEPSAKFNCTCRKGYTGTQCEIDEDNCASFPCLNGGTCTDLIGGFLCTCPDGFHGNICTADHCEECKNGATCVNGFCQCGRKYTGIDCGKEKFADFDLFFAGHTGNSRMPVEAVQHTEVMSVCLWVRYLHPNGQGTFFTLFAENVEQKMIPALQINGSGIHIQYLAPKTFVRASVNDGRWHHLCYMWTEDQEWIVYLDGLVKETGQDSGSLSSRQSVTLGYTGTNKSHDAIFIGELAHVNMYYFALNDSDIQQMSESCHDNQLPGNRLSWIEFDSYIEGDVKVVRPMLCGSSDCPHGYRGYYCNITIDKVPPTVVNCTADFFVVSDDRRLVMVNWTEPVFSDNVRIMSIEQSHRPGQVFTYGVYDVHYTAYDEDGNSATCSFNIYVTPSHCKMPDKPESVLLDCKEGADFTYCQISCKHPTENAFSEPVPKFYKCGIEGLWDPPRGRNFLLPSCAPTSVPNGAVKGSMGFNGPQCTDQSRNVLKQQFILSMEQWNTQFKLCPEEGCSFDIMVECGAVSEGKKRKRRNADGPYLVLFNFPVNGSSLSNSEVQPLSNLKTSVKNGDFNVNNFAADSNSLVVTADFSCSPGQMLIMEAGAEKCVSCAVGTFFNNITKACELCLEGFYSSDDSQTQCTPCPSGKTTQDRGSTSVTQCYSVCETGHYYGQGQCRKCLHGYYQDQKGQRECKSCPNGQTTESEGAVSKNQCQGGCRPGTELSVRGICVPCGRGTYKENITQNACKKCPYNFTTDGEGATSRDKCNVVLCDRGYYRVLSSNTCDPCPKGLYQPYRGQEKCYACDAGLTTTHRGSVDAMQCVPGDIDECKEGTHTCDINAVCENTVNSYICTCRDNYYGNGTYCQEHTLIKESHDGISSNIIVYGVVGGVSFAIIVAAVLSVIIFWRRSKRRKKLPDDSDVNYQAHPNVHREKERVQFPLVAIPVFNPSFDGSLSRSDPTQSLTGNPVIELKTWKRSVYFEESDESGSWQEPLSSESSNSPSFTGAENDSDIMNGNFSIHSDSYF